MIGLSVLLFSGGSVLAHEGREVDGYNLIVGFIKEPAIEGMLNGISVRITSKNRDNNGGDGHGHGSSSGMKMEPEIDLVTHGGVFVDELAPGDHYEFAFGDEFEGLTVPFHAHPVETEGTIMIGPFDPQAAIVLVEINDHGFEPVETLIRPGTTVRFMNRMDDPTVIMSGILTSAPVTGGEHGVSNPVTGLDDLQVEVTHLSSDVSRVMTLDEASGDPGLYKAEFIPTSPGRYRFRVFGDIGETAINETFESSQTTFDEVIAANEIQFPIQLSSHRETENATRGALDTAASAASRASDARNFASVALIFGILATITGVIGAVLGALAIRRFGRLR
jgi:hypothetical protein